MFNKTRRNFGLLALGGAATAAAATPAFAGQGNTEDALSSLCAAQDALHWAEGAKGGHRASWMNLVQRAITETQAGIEFGDTGGKIGFGMFSDCGEAGIMNGLKSAGGMLAALLAFGLALMHPANAAGYAPLNCKLAASAAERTICSDYRLGQSEARVATLYAVTTSLVAMGQRGTIQDDQRAFLKQRDACGSDAACLRSAYAARDKQLEAVMSGIQQRAPF